jgi:hypothetical protein
VTVPPDASPARAVAQPAEAPAQGLPSFTAGEALKTPAASTSDEAGKATATAAPAPDTTKHKAPAETGAIPAAAPAAAKTADATTAKPADKTKQSAKVSPCKDLDESACGANKLCSWVVPVPDAAGKVGKAKCRSLALLKKEAAKGAKTGKQEVLPWAPKTTETPPPQATTDGNATPPHKTKTASVKKTTKPKEIAPPIPTASVSKEEAPQSPPPAATSEAPALDPQ